MSRTELSYARAVKLLLIKDIRLELRSKQTLMTMLLFGGVLTMMYAIGFETDPGTNRKVFPGVVWGALLFTGALGVGRTFARENAAGAFEAIILSRVPRSALLWSKLLINVLLISLVMTVVVPLFAVMLRVDLSGCEAVLALQVLVGAIGFSAVATPLSVIATSARFPEVLLPMVIFPLVTPVLIAGVKGTGVLMGTAIGDNPWGWLSFSASFAVVFLAIGVLLFDRLVTE